MKTSPDLETLAGASWAEVLTHLDDAVLVMDAERTLRFVNPRARRMLGYRDGEAVGGRCRANTNGIDCEAACPLTFALEKRLDRIEDFETVYHTRDGRPVALSVTLIPLRAADGSFHGAVEILRPVKADPGFYLAGSSPEAHALRQRLRQIAVDGSHIVLCGQSAACEDVARVIHRFSWPDETHFESWNGGWDEVEPWPPGTMFAAGELAAGAPWSSPPDGWRLIVAVSDSELLDAPPELRFERLSLPPFGARCGDLPEMVVARVRQLRPELKVSPEALERVVRVARDGGLDRMEQILRAAVSVADDQLEPHHLPVDGYRAELIDEILRDPNPLAALEATLLREVLDRCCWRVQEAADRLGMSRVTLWRKMRDHGIERPGCTPNGSNS